MDIVAGGNLCPQALDDRPDYTNAVQDVIGSECLGLLSLKKVTFK